MDNSSNRPTINRRRALATLILSGPAGLAVASCSGSGGGSTTGGAPATSGGGTGSGKALAGAALQFAVIPKGTTHEYWKSIHAGAMKASQELAQKGQAINIIWKGPLKEDDKNGQIDVVETFINQKVDGIVLAPLDSNALVHPVEEAHSSGIPVVIIDSGVKTDQYASFVATDNKKGGGLAGQRLIELLGGKGRVILLKYMEGSASTEDREAGFLEAIMHAPGIQLISSDQHAGATVDSAYSTSQNLISRFGTQTDGIFTPNESSTRGMLRALQQAKLAGKMRFVGFDSSQDLVDALKAKTVQGLVVQNPLKMGYLGVMTLVQAIRKQPVEKRIDTGVSMVTPENMDTPAMKELLFPPLDQYLK